MVDGRWISPEIRYQRATDILPGGGHAFTTTFCPISVPMIPTAGRAGSADSDVARRAPAKDQTRGLWREVAIGAAVVSTVGIVLFSAIWPGGEAGLRALHIGLALVMSAAILASQLLLNWPETSSRMGPPIAHPRLSAAVHSRERKDRCE